MPLAIYANVKEVEIRNAEPGDYARVIDAVDEWWGGRAMRDMLPKLFFVHFRPTSFVAVDGGTVVGFLVGFRSQSDPALAYVHFAGVHPSHREHGVGRALYERFFAVAVADGCRSVRCVTAPINRPSVAFHRRLGFTVVPGEAVAADTSYHRDYDGAGEDRVLLERALTSADLRRPGESDTLRKVQKGLRRPMTDPLEARDFRDCVGAFATGVTVVTTHLHRVPAGMTLNSFTSISLDPLLVLISLAGGTRTLETVRASERFAVNVLHRRQRDVALAFAKRGEPFPEGHTVLDPHGFHTVRHALATMRCRVEAIVPAGDHELVIGEVISFEGSGGEPLIFHRGAFGGLDADALVPSGRVIGLEFGPI